ncbi:BQ2448_3800 [Microbotryum intermedium]|uniref:BQ2448_3800 protein n=1 Tax=Microbotryum intermedium TaxID=269621 RepID=A0A238FIM6_9BASI|nr:BQ2448_3800 [Microbotryum intermedium]
MERDSAEEDWPTTAIHLHDTKTIGEFLLGRKSGTDRFDDVHKRVKTRLARFSKDKARAWIHGVKKEFEGEEQRKKPESGHSAARESGGYGSDEGSSQHWVEKIASLAGAQEGTFRYYDETFSLSLLKTTTNTNKRKPDRCLVHGQQVGRPSFADVVAVFEFTIAAKLRSLSKSQKAKKPPNFKLLQLFNNVKAVLLERPTTDYAFGFGVNLDRAYTVVLDHESTHVVELEDCWGEHFSHMAALLYIVLNVDFFSVGFSARFRHAYEPKEGVSEKDVRVEFLGAKTQALVAAHTKGLDRLKVGPLKSQPPCILAHHGSGNCATFKLATSSPGIHLWITWRLLEHGENEDENIRELAVSREIIEKLPPENLGHFALVVDYGRIPASARRLLDLPNGLKRKDITLLTIAVPMIPGGEEYRSLLDKQLPPLVSEFIGMVASALDVVFALADSGILHRYICARTLLHANGVPLLVCDWSNATFSGFKSTRRFLDVDPDTITNAYLLNNHKDKDFRTMSTVYHEVEGVQMIVASVLGRYFVDADKSGKAVWSMFQFGRHRIKDSEMLTVARARQSLCDDGMRRGISQGSSVFEDCITDLTNRSKPLAKLFEIILHRRSSAAHEGVLKRHV